MKNLMKHVASLIVLIVFGILSFGSADSDTDTQQVQTQVPSYTITAGQLFQEYDANEVAADSKYKGKIVIVSGIILDIGKDITDDAYIVVGGSGMLDGVQCSFTESQQSSIAKLSKGQHVSVKGEVDGKMGNVLISKASLQ